MILPDTPPMTEDELNDAIANAIQGVTDSDIGASDAVESTLEQLAYAAMNEIPTDPFIDAVRAAYRATS